MKIINYRSVKQEDNSRKTWQHAISPINCAIQGKHAIPVKISFWTYHKHTEFKAGSLSLDTSSLCVIYFTTVHMSLTPMYSNVLKYTLTWTEVLINFCCITLQHNKYTNYLTDSYIPQWQDMSHQWPLHHHKLHQIVVHFLFSPENTYFNHINYNHIMLTDSSKLKYLER